MACTLDPFTTVIEQLWDLIEANTYLADHIKPGNRIKMSGRKQIPEKSNLQDGDLPQLVIVPTGGPARPHFTSSSVSLTEQFVFHLVTGNLTVDSILFPVKWELLKMLVTATSTNLDLDFVVNADLVDDMIEGFDNKQEENRGTAGWSLGLTLTVLMSFNRVDNEIVYP